MHKQEWITVIFPVGIAWLPPGCCILFSWQGEPLHICSCLHDHKHHIVWHFCYSSHNQHHQTTTLHNQQQWQQWMPLRHPLLSKVSNFISKMLLLATDYHQALTAAGNVATAAMSFLLFALYYGSHITSYNIQHPQNHYIQHPSWHPPCI